MTTIARALGQLVGIFLDGLDLQHKLLVGLVGTMRPHTLWLDHHAHPVTQLGGGDGLDGGAKVVDIKASAQSLGQAGLHEFHHQQLALPANVYTDLGV